MVEIWRFLILLSFKKPSQDIENRYTFRPVLPPLKWHTKNPQVVPMVYIYSPGKSRKLLQPCASAFTEYPLTATGRFISGEPGPAAVTKGVWRENSSTQKNPGLLFDSIDVTGGPQSVSEIPVSGSHAYSRWTLYQHIRQTRNLHIYHQDDTLKLWGCSPPVHRAQSDN